MAHPVPYLNLKDIILKKIQEHGGWVNTHAHMDRAYTVTPELYKLANKHRHEKWKLNKELRINSTVEQIYDRMAQATETLLAQGATATGTFIDVDSDVKDKSIKAALKVRETYKDQMIFKFLNQSSYGLFDPEARKWFDYGSEFVDIIGGLLKADQGRESEHLDILLGTAKEKGKMVHVHVDELNIPEEKETEMLLKKTIEHSMQGQVVGVHAISINCHPKEYRENLYKQLAENKMMFISNPMSWINARRSETMAPIHNPVIALDEMHPQTRSRGEVERPPRQCRDTARRRIYF